MRCAVFVDAGYLFAGGADVLTGSHQPRANMTLKIEEIVKQLRSAAKETADNAQLLRIMWYDGMVGRTRSPQQEELARTNDVKLRLGTVTNSGQQKGVDSLIVTDLIDLARNQAISDAVLVSGDADIRVGVELAQKFGVRVHLIEISSYGQYNVSVALQEEADTVKAWTKQEIQNFLSINSTSTPAGPFSSELPTTSKIIESPDEAFRLTVKEILDSTSDEDLGTLSEELASNPQSIPQLYDGRLLGGSRNKLNRNLEQPEKAKVRTMFRQCVKERSALPHDKINRTTYTPVPTPGTETNQERQI